MILRSLAHFGLVEFHKKPGYVPVIVDHSDLFASHAGLFRSSVEPGDAVAAGQQVGTRSGLDGVALETLRAPRPGIVIWRSAQARFCSAERSIAADILGAGVKQDAERPMARFHNRPAWQIESEQISLR